MTTERTSTADATLTWDSNSPEKALTGILSPEPAALTPAMGDPAPAMGDPAPAMGDSAPDVNDFLAELLLADSVNPPFPDEEGNVLDTILSEVDGLLATGWAPPLNEGERWLAAFSVQVARCVPAACAVVSPPEEASYRFGWSPFYKIQGDGKASLVKLHGLEALKAKYVVRMDGRGFMAVDTLEALERLRGIPGVHEVVDGTLPHRIVFDIDYCGGDKEEVLRLFLEALLDETMAAYGSCVAWTPEEWLKHLVLATSSSSEKLSIHALFAGLQVRDAHELKGLTLAVIARLDGLTQEVLGYTAACVDKGVPKEQFSLRLLGSEKPGTGRVKSMTQASVDYGWTALRDYLVQPHGTSEPIAYRAFGPRAAATKKEEVLDAEVGAVVTAVALEFPEFEFRSAKGRFVNFDRLCASFCVICGHDHENENSLYAAKGGDGNWRAYCRRADQAKSAGHLLSVASLSAGEACDSENPTPAMKKTSEFRSPKDRRDEIERRVAARHLLELPAKTCADPQLAPLELTKQKLLGIRAGCGIGKTEAMIAGIERLDSKRAARIALVSKVRHAATSSDPRTSIIIVAPQVALVQSVKRKVRHLGFELYSELPPGEISPERHGRLVITPESLWRLAGTAYHIAILEEARQLLGVFSSPTMTERPACTATFKGLLRYAKHVTILDANLDQPLMAFYQRLAHVGAEEVTFEANIFAREQRRVNFWTIHIEWLARVYEHVKAGLRVMICGSMSPRRAKCLAASLSTECGVKAMAYTGEMTDSEKTAAFADFDATLEREGADVVILTPVVTSGVSLVRSEFDVVCANYQSRGGMCAATAFQQLHRARVVKSKLVEILVDLRRGWVPRDDADLLRFVSDVHHPARAADSEDPILAHCQALPATKGPKGALEYEMSDDLAIQLYNVRESILGKARFVETLAGMLEVQGYTLHAGETPENLSEGKGLAADLRLGCAADKTRSAEVMGTAPILPPEVVAELSGARNNLSAEEQASLARHELAAFYQVEPEHVTPAFIKIWAQPEARCKYMNRKLAAQGADALSASYTLRVTHDVRAFANIHSYVPKIVVLDRILHGIGFANGIYTQCVVPRKELDSAIAIYASAFAAEERSNSRALGIRGGRNTGRTLKAVLDYIEEPLETVFGAKLRRERNYDGKITSVQLQLPPEPIHILDTL